jgi:hypothetical protein
MCISHLWKVFYDLRFERLRRIVGWCCHFLISVWFCLSWFGLAGELSNDSVSAIALFLVLRKGIFSYS